MKCILFLRGHVRTALETKQLSAFVQKLGWDVYIHTWDESEAKLSWRTLDRRQVSKITKQQLKHYFKKCNVKHITIENDERIHLHGTTEGNVGGISKLAWKRYWYGQYNNIEHFHGENCLCVSMRFDIFNVHVNNSYIEHMTEEYLMSRFAKVNSNSITFLYDENMCGNDNMIGGSLQYMKKLLGRFHFHLDDIMGTYDVGKHQELLVQKVANDLKE